MSAYIMPVNEDFCIIIDRSEVQYDFLSLPVGRYGYGTLVPHLIDKIGSLLSGQKGTVIVLLNCLAIVNRRLLPELEKSNSYVHSPLRLIHSDLSNWGLGYSGRGISLAAFNVKDNNKPAKIRCAFFIIYFFCFAFCAQSVLVYTKIGHLTYKRGNILFNKRKKLFILKNIGGNIESNVENRRELLSFK